MPFPFRNPTFNTGDGDPPEWTPPDYAQPTADNKDNEEEWKPPEYATATKEEAPKKPSVFSKIKEALTPAKTIHATGSLIPNVLKDASKSEPETYWGGFLKGMKEELTPTKEGIREAFSAKNPALQAGAHPQTLQDFLSLVIPGELPAAARGEIPGIRQPRALEEIPTEAKAAEEIPIRQSAEKPYRMGGSVQAPEDIALPSEVKQPPKQKPNFVNPFEKKSETPTIKEGVPREWALPEDPDVNAKTAIANRRTTEQQLYDLASKKQKMGLERPAEEAQPAGEEWKPPSYAKEAIEEPQAARTESGKLAIGADIKSLGKVLGTSLYKGDIAPIATKELLQNSIDAVRHLGSEGKIDVILDRHNNIIHVSDNGKGLTKEELESVFTDLGASGKRSDTEAAGGFGLAKAAPLLGGEKVEVSSITKDANGIFHEHSFEGTPSELLEGVDIKHRIVPEEVGSKINPVTEEPQTGTTVKVHVPKDSDFYSAGQFVDNLSEHSPNVQSQIRLGHNYSGGEYNPEHILNPLSRGGGTSLATLDSPSATTELIEPKSSSRGSRSYMQLHLSNNGMYQGTKSIYFPQEVPNIPKGITVDIRSKVPEGHADYPFTANREELRGSVEKQVQEYINKNIVKPGVGKRLDELKRLYNSMQEITVGKGQFPNTFGRKIAIYDPKGQITPGEMQSITSNSAFHTLTNNIGSILDEAMKVAGTSEWRDRLEKVGIIFEDKLYGIHIPNPKSGKSAILINPFNAIGKMSPDEASANILHTILHEMAHIEPGQAGHNESFTIRLGEIYGKFGARRSVEAQEQILKSIADPNTGVYHPEIQEILSTYKESRGREAATEDLLSGTGIGSRSKGGGEGDIPSGDKSDAEGVATNTKDALDKLFNSMGKTLEQRVQQDVINKTERARRFAAFASVKEEGIAGAKKSLSTLKGEFEKVDPEKLLLNPKETDTLFTAVKRANVTEGEKARGYTALFKLLNGELPQRNELRILDDVFGNGFADRITQMHGGIGAVGLKVSKLANTMKSMQNAMSLAAPLRHGIGLAYRSEFRPAFADMFKFFTNKEYYDSAMQAITERPNYLLKKEAGLFTAKPGSLLNSEEEFLNSYAGNIPIARNVVGASQRGYVGFLNKLRDDVSENMLKTAEGLGYKKATVIDDQMIPTKETKAIMRFVNVFTGRGELPFGLEKMTNELNTLLWSPRMMASRIQMFTNPKIYMDLPKGMRLEGLKSLLAVASLGTVIDTALAYAGAKISYNILSTDFGKSRFGTKLVDPWGGLQQYVVGAARFLAGKTDSSTPTNRLEIAGRFLANKESPAASLAHTLLTSKPTRGGSQGDITTQYGEKTNIQSQIGKQFVPIFIQDLNDLIQSDPNFSENIGLDAIMGAASLAGMEQSYPEKKKLQIRKLK